MENLNTQGMTDPRFIKILYKMYMKNSLGAQISLKEQKIFSRRW